MWHVTNLTTTHRFEQDPGRVDLSWRESRPTRESELLSFFFVTSCFPFRFFNNSYSSVMSENVCVYAVYILSKIFKFYNYQYTILSKGILRVCVLFKLVMFTIHSITTWWKYGSNLDSIWILASNRRELTALLDFSRIKTHGKSYILLFCLLGYTINKYMT